MKKIIIALGLLVVLVYLGCQKEILPLGGDNGKYSLRLNFSNTVSGAPLLLGNTYQTPFSEEYTLKTFKYYISNITLRTTSGAIETVTGYYLINEEEPLSKIIVIPVSSNRYNQIAFLLGVDSTRNVSGTQTGALDPANGMFWTWNSGYIMAKLEATSPVSTETTNKVEYHIGGFKTGQNSTRQINFTLTGENEIAIKNNGSSQINFTADANTWFKAVNDLKIVTEPVCVMPGALAMKFADNYATMFKLTNVANN